MISQNLENNRLKLFGKRERVLYSNNNMEIKKVTTSSLNSILLSGELDNGYKIYIQIPISAIEESVRISNNLLLIIGVIAIVIAGIAVSYVSRRFTNPILELNVIANKMSKLDFSKKYEPTGSNDEIDELADSKILKLPEFNEYGNPMKIASLFGGLNGYLNAVHQVQNALYCA